MSSDKDASFYQTLLLHTHLGGLIKSTYHKPTNTSYGEIRRPTSDQLASSTGSDDDYQYHGSIKDYRYDGSVSDDSMISHYDLSNNDDYNPPTSDHHNRSTSDDYNPSNNDDYNPSNNDDYNPSSSDDDKPWEFTDLASSSDSHHSPTSYEFAFDDTFTRCYDHYPANRRLIKDNTREIDVNLDLTTERGKSRQMKANLYEECDISKKILQNKVCLKEIHEIIKSVNPQSILTVRWEVGKPKTGEWNPFDLYEPYLFNPDCFGHRTHDPELFEPTTLGYAIHAKRFLQTFSTFTNLKTLQYFSHDTTSRFEDEISKTVEMLPNLETLVLVRAWHEVKDWNSEEPCPTPGFNEDELSKSVGQRLSSLKTLKRLHLQGLVAPRESWSELDWKSPLECLKVAQCQWLHGLSVFPFAHVFRRTLLALSIGHHLPANWKDVEEPEIRFVKDFEVLEELQLLTSFDHCVEELEQRLLDDISQAPKLKHFETFFNFSHHLFPHITNGIQKDQPVWPSLQTIVANDGRSRDYRRIEFPHLDKKPKTKKNQSPFRFGLLYVEWKQHERLLCRRGWPINKSKSGLMSFSDGRVIEVQTEYTDLDDDIEFSLEFVDISRYLSSLNEASEDSEDSEVDDMTRQASEVTLH
ncbi:uncharacterized protein MELLADRAFT_108627 [Melampsora larici-populina 98AG31]|uniref:Uncharacterized protein n=1 Tax=Melampsora larici-populina (strain 98AG31 / pathotype 3-4-7) TaxID=747676 RepID=F4RTQ7_MELLP|nr:uncharacterized protein MELLADRAFT_108627 [Melampsora larici-populina 98AG31]EGG04049.1 hypothetical protein MELLADRAFT_108627 [Melampsora larici-populina 98AG31]